MHVVKVSKESLFAVFVQVEAELDLGRHGFNVELNGLFGSDWYSSLFTLTHV